MLTITTTALKIQIDKDGKKIGRYAKNSLYYKPAGETLGLYLLSSENHIASERWQNGISIDGKQVTNGNADELFEALFINGGSSPAPTPHEYNSKIRIRTESGRTLLFGIDFIEEVNPYPYSFNGVSSIIGEI